MVRSLSTPHGPRQSFFPTFKIKKQIKKSKKKALRLYSMLTRRLEETSWIVETRKSENRPKKKKKKEKRKKRLSVMVATKNILWNLDTYL